MKPRSDVFTHHVQQSWRTPTQPKNYRGDNWERRNRWATELPDAAAIWRLARHRKHTYHQALAILLQSSEALTT